MAQLMNDEADKEKVVQVHRESLRVGLHNGLLADVHLRIKYLSNYKPNDK
jgi:hypothetical protein